jgi:glucokinase
MAPGRLPSDAIVLGLDVGGTQIRCAAILPDGQRLGRLSAPTPAGVDPEAIYSTCATLLRALEDRLPAEVRGRVAAIGISSMGPVDPWRGTVVDPPNVPAFRDAPLADEMERRLGLPTWLDKDTNVAALAERWLGAARGCEDFLYITVSTGLGGAIFRNGSLLLGPDGSAGELGHVCLMPVGGPRCGCGGTGHLEAIASGSGLAAQAREVLATGKLAVATSWSLSWTVEAEADASTARATAPASLAGSVAAPARVESSFLSRRAASGRVTGKDVADGEDAGDEVCRILMTRARTAFAIACVGWVDAFNPEKIVVGGTVAENQGRRWLEPAREAIGRTAFSVPGARVRLVSAELGADVGLVGARALVAERFGVPEWRARRPRSGE